MKEKSIRKIIYSILISILIVIIVFLIWYYEPMIKGQFENLKSVEIVYYTSVLYGKKESIIITNNEEMELFYKTIQKTSVEKIHHDTEWVEEPPEWRIILHFGDGEESLNNGVSSHFVACGVRKFFRRGDSQGMIIGSNEELYLLVNETIVEYTGKVYSSEERGYVLP